MWRYKVFSRPELAPLSKSPVMDWRGMEAWLNEMDDNGWEFVGCGETDWINKEAQTWWVFRKPTEEG